MNRGVSIPSQKGEYVCGELLKVTHEIWLAELLPARNIRIFSLKYKGKKGNRIAPSLPGGRLARKTL